MLSASISSTITLAKGKTVLLLWHQSQRLNSYCLAPQLSFSYIAMEKLFLSKLLTRKYLVLLAVVFQKSCCMNYLRINYLTHTLLSDRESISFAFIQNLKICFNYAISNILNTLPFFIEHECIYVIRRQVKYNRKCLRHLPGDKLRELISPID